MKISIIYYSSTGHTRELAEAVSKGATQVEGAQVSVLAIKDEDINQGRWRNEAIVEQLNASDAIVFGTPTYMGGYSAQMKAFIDACGGIWAKQGWKDKVGAGFTHSGGLSGDKLNTLNGLIVNALQHGMVWVGQTVMPEGSNKDQINRIGSYSGLMAQSDYGQDKAGAGDLKTAEIFGQRVAQATQRWLKGAAVLERR